MRNIKFANGEFYHVYNRGVEKRNIFIDKYDVGRFFQSMREFNTTEPIGSLYAQSFHERPQKTTRNNHHRLVNFVSYCLNPNHFHFILEQISDRGVEKIMHKVACGYTRYFNEKYKRTGVLFQGTYKAIHIDSNEYLLHLSAYVNLNHRIHKLSSLATKFGKSSWEEYILQNGNKKKLCTRNIVLSQFKNAREYKEFALASLKDIRDRKELFKELENFLLE